MADGMYISDSDSAKKMVVQHLQSLANQDPIFEAAYKHLLAMIIVDTFMLRDKPQTHTVKEFTDTYITMFKEALGINLTSLDEDA